MAEFIDQRFPTDINYGSGFRDIGATAITTTISGEEYRVLDHPFVKCALDVDFLRQDEVIIEQIIDLNRKANGMFRAFRAYNFNDYSTNNYRDNPTAFDQPLSLISSGVYQMVRWYGSPSDPKAARRIIRKPINPTAIVGVSGTIYPQSLYSVNYSTGIVTMAANKTGAITGITKGVNTVITVNQSMSVGDSVYISGVTGMTQINGIRAVITARNASSITIAVNSSLFSDYVSGGTVNTRPQSGEAVTFGCLFDIPMRFDADLSGVFQTHGILSVSGVGLIEVLNP